jgi:hypothetical protein
MTRHALAPAYLLACLLLGGASAAGFLGNGLLQIAAIPLIGWSLWHLLQNGPTQQARVPLMLLGLLVAVLVTQLIPLPPAIWTLLPGRDAVVEGYRLLGVPPPWLPLTLAPDDALSSLLWLLPAFAAFLTTVVLGGFRGRWIAGVLVGVTVTSIALGALQVVGGDTGGAYLYATTNHGVAVGFFANGNHNATLLLVCIPFLAALQATLLRQKSSPRSVSAIRLMTTSIYVMIVVGLLINASLAGIGLCVPVTLVTWFMFGRQRPAIRRGLLVATVLASVATIATIAIGPFGNNLFGQQKNNAELSRQTSFRLTWQASGEYFPVGSGVGSFQPVYRTQEPLDMVTTTYMNHAHSDWLEILLETGLCGMVLASMFLVWWLRRASTILKAEEPDHFARAAIIAIAAILLHSIVDYPLRTAAISAVFAICVGLMSGVRPYVRPRKTETTTRHLSL